MENKPSPSWGPGSWGTAPFTSLKMTMDTRYVFGEIFPNKSMKLIPIILTNTTLKMSF